MMRNSTLGWAMAFVVFALAFASACQATVARPTVEDPSLKSFSTVADPFVISAPTASGVDKEYLYSTNSSGVNVPVRTRNIFGGWGDLADAMPTRPGWAVFNTVWAPEVLHRPADATSAKFVLYYSAEHSSYGVHCIGTATSPTASGPFTAQSAPLKCETDCGSIDGSPYTAPDGNLYFAWKWDAQHCDVENGNQFNPQLINIIRGQQMTADGLGFTGAVVDLLEADPAGWEGHNVEAPTIYPRNGALHFFYSGGQHWNGSYAEGHAVCAAALGPCLRTGGPIVSTNSQFCGPGHAGPWVTPSGLSKIVFHAYKADECTNGEPNPGAGRKLFEAHLCFDNTTPGPLPGGTGCEG